MNQIYVPRLLGGFIVLICVWISAAVMIKCDDGGKKRITAPDYMADTLRDKKMRPMYLGDRITQNTQKEWQKR